jgi:lysophospholipase L1-like esterase
MLSCRFILARTSTGRRYHSLVFLGAFFAARCGSPTAPTPPPVDPAAPTIACPAPQTAQSLGGATVVSYPSPVASDGKEPLSATCMPASGSAFGVGASKVTCWVTDAIQRSASCTFSVTVVPPVVPPVEPPSPRLSATRFVAFGDSITEGKFADASFSADPYPLVVQALLRSRYAQQAGAISVSNRGLSGETAAVTPQGTGGGVRLPRVLAEDRPEVLLLLEGVNDIVSGNPTTIQTMIDGLRLMVQQGRRSGAQVMIATLLPERAGPGTPSARNGALPLLDQANDQIRRLAEVEGAALVDLFQGLGGTPDPWIGSDNLHPNDTGYQKIAELWFDAIRLQFDTSPAPTLTAGFLTGPAGRRGHQ